MSDGVVAVQLQGGPGDGYRGTCSGASSLLYTVMPEDGSQPRLYSYRRTADRTAKGRLIYRFDRFVANLGMGVPS